MAVHDIKYIRIKFEVNPSVHWVCHRLVVLESGLGLESGLKSFFLLDLDLDFGSKNSDLDLDLKAMDLDLDSDLQVLPASHFFKSFLCLKTIAL